MFKGGSKEMLFGAKQNMLGCVERDDDAGVEAAIEELSGMNPTAPAPAKSPLLGGKWRLVWSKQADTANPFQRAFGKAAKKNYQIIDLPAGNLENLVELGPLTVSGMGRSHHDENEKGTAVYSSMHDVSYRSTTRTVRRGVYSYRAFGFGTGGGKGSMRGRSHPTGSSGTLVDYHVTLAFFREVSYYFISCSQKYQLYANRT